MNFSICSDGYGLDIEHENIFFCNDNKWNISRAMECQGFINFTTNDFVSGSY